MEKISANDVLVKELEAMGFEKKKAEEALIETGNESVSKAVSWIASRPIDSDNEFIDDGDVVYDEETTKTGYVYKAKHVAKGVNPFENFEKAFGNAERVEIRVPSKWKTVPTSPRTFARVLYSQEYLFFGFELEKDTLKRNANLKPTSTSDSRMPDWMPTLLQDDRCEVFLWVQTKEDKDKQIYYALEVTRSGLAIVSSTKFYRKFDFSVDIRPVFAKSGPFSSGKDSDTMVFGIALKDIVEDTKDLFDHGDVIIRMGLYRGTRIDEKDGEFSWASWVDPEDDKIDFHRPETFGYLKFE